MKLPCKIAVLISLDGGSWDEHNPCIGEFALKLVYKTLL